jgi:DNA-binding CsgD family transcriptional regulator
MFVDERPASSQESPLTPRQRIALQLVSEGLCTKVIADVMGISESGAKKHLDCLRRRYRVANRAHLVRRAYELGDLVATTPLRSEQESSSWPARWSASSGVGLAVDVDLV